MPIRSTLRSTCAPKPSWVVDDWLNPEIPIRDNWRKELYDAAKFDPAVGRQVLISNEEFKARLCRAGRRSLWVWGNNSDGRTTGAARPDAGGDQRQVPDLEGRGGPALRQRVCGGTPKAG